MEQERYGVLMQEAEGVYLQDQDLNILEGSW